MRTANCAALIVVSVLMTDAAHSKPDTIHAHVIGEHGFMQSDWYLCPAWEVFKKFKKLLSEDTGAAFVLGDRDCKQVRDQTEVVVENTNDWFGPWAICVRPIGSPDCGWVPYGFITKALCKPLYISKNQDMQCVPRTEPDNPQRRWSAGYSGK
jgi:hypothetical protein